MVVYFLVAAVLAIVATWCVLRLATRVGAVDVPDTERKKHNRPVPLLGGVALFISFWAVVGYLVTHPVFGIELLIPQLRAVFFGSLILVVMGVLDDLYDLSARVRLGITALAALVTVLGGLGLTQVTNPLGGLISLELGAVTTFFGTVFVLADVLVFLWLMGMMYTTKLLDGLDGLATGVVAIGSLIIFGLTMTARFYQPNVGLVALIFAAVCLGFLLFNFSPAKIFLGEAGSLFIGFMLGVLAVISGGKVATAFLVVAIPVLDVARVLYLRLKHKQSIFKGDRTHLHFSLVDSGLSERQVVLLFYTCAAVFGVAALFLQSIGKVVVLIGVFAVMAYIALRVQFNQKR